jgi:hypothetical protein
MLPDDLGHLFDGPLPLPPSEPAVVPGGSTLAFADRDARARELATADP